MPGDHLDMGVACFAVTWDGIHRRRDDQFDIRPERVPDCRCRRRTIIGAVADEKMNKAGHIGRHFGQSVCVRGCQAGGHKRCTLGIEANVQFAPCFTGLREPVFLLRPACKLSNRQRR